MAKGIKRRLIRALNAAEKTASNHDGSKYARGLSVEGYAGGYAAALRDVLLLLDGIEPSYGQGFWTHAAQRPKSAARVAGPLD